MPNSETNNVWFHQQESSSVIVFVHGVLSDSVSCWTAKGNAQPVYWPELIRKDPRLQNPSIFLGGYYTDVDSGQYAVNDCAKELLTALRLPVPTARRTVLDHQRIVFICHSTGGIVVRYLLESQSKLFADKEVGLLLMASPSYGSKLADALGGLAEFYDNQLGRELRWGNALLNDLDDRFKEMLDKQSIPRFDGIEACENHFIVHRRFLPDVLKVVEKISAGRYFTVRMLPNTDHFSIVKPTSEAHPAHTLLVEFWLKHYGPPLATDLLKLLEASKEAMRSKDLPYHTPALMVSLLHRSGVLASALSAVGQNYTYELRANFENYLSNVLPELRAGCFENFEWYDHSHVRSAQKIALEDESSTVEEVHLVRAVLASDAKSVEQMREHLGADFQRLLCEVQNPLLWMQSTPGMFHSPRDKK
jgi:hypothetical protein